MRKVIVIIEGMIDRLCDFSHHLSSKDTTPSLINAPEYLFVSTKVAKSFPYLMESIFVRTFITHLPGECSKLWMDRSWWSDMKLATVSAGRGTNLLRIASIASLILIATVIKLIGATPYE